MKRPPAILAALCLLAAGCGKSTPAARRAAPMEPPAFWVWHRGSPLDPAEIARLREAGTRKLFWEVVECRWTGTRWDAARIAKFQPPPAGISLVPVFRIKPDPAFLGSPAAVKSLHQLILLWAAGNPLEEIQLDFDCPDRVLESYGKFLRELRRELGPKKLSITALAAWPRHPAFPRLARSVDSLAPMFYDLTPDRPENVRQRRFQPMAARSSRALVAAWSACPVPWLAGLPNFERVSIFHPDGRLSGHLRGGSNDGLFLLPGWTPQPLGDGVTLFEPAKSVTFRGTEIAAKSIVVHRMPDAVILRDLANAAEAAGARGIVYFVLPGPGIQAAYSASHLAGTGPPQLSLRFPGNGTAVLANAGPGDLPANPAGWELVLEARGIGHFHQGNPGDFATVSSPAPAEIATRLTLKFPRLPAGETLSTGPLIANPAGIRWSISGVTNSVGLEEKSTAVKNR